MAVSQQKVELLFVQNSTGIEYNKAKSTLRMKNIAHSTLFFTDRPVRMAGHYHTRDEFLPLWSEGPDSFAKNPPNATLSMLEVGKPDLVNAVVNLRNPRMQGKDLIYDISIIEGTVPPSAGEAVLFIDILGFWRRNIRRVAVIGTAAAVTTAAVATSAAEASAAASQAAAAKAAAAKPAPPPTVNVQITEKAPAAPPAPSTAQKLEQLKALEKEGLITRRSIRRPPRSSSTRSSSDRGRNECTLCCVVFVCLGCRRVDRRRRHRSRGDRRSGFAHTTP